MNLNFQGKMKDMQSSMDQMQSNIEQLQSRLKKEGSKPKSAKKVKTEPRPSFLPGEIIDLT
jgi:hypothetical protein